MCVHTHTHIHTYIPIYVRTKMCTIHTRTRTHLPRYYWHLLFYIFQMILLYNTLKMVPLLAEEVIFKFKHGTVALMRLSIFWYCVLPDHGLFQPKHIVSQFSYNIHSCDLLFVITRG